MLYTYQLSPGLQCQRWRPIRSNEVCRPGQVPKNDLPSALKFKRALELPCISQNVRHLRTQPVRTSWDTAQGIILLQYLEWPLRGKEVPRRHVASPVCRSRNTSITTTCQLPPVTMWNKTKLKLQVDPLGILALPFLLAVKQRQTAKSISVTLVFESKTMTSPQMLRPLFPFMSHHGQNRPLGAAFESNSLTLTKWNSEDKTSSWRLDVSLLHISDNYCSYYPDFG